MTKRLNKPPSKSSYSILESNSSHRISFSPIDKITVAYCAWICIYMLIGWPRTINPGHHFPAYLGVLTMVFLFAWAEYRLQSYQPAPHRLLKLIAFTRSIYPVALFGYFFVSGFVFNRIIFHEWQDPFFYKIDYAIFGYYPSLVWGTAFTQPFVQDLFHFAYFCYYPMIVGLPVYLYFTNKEGFRETIFSLTFVFYLCYFIYSILPVIGGRYFPEAMELSRQSSGYIFSDLMAFIYRTSTHLGGAFPSSHVAITIVLTISALRHVRKLGLLFCVIAFFLTIATVFCHYHWFIDSICGLLTGIGGYYLALWVNQKLTKEIE